MWAYYVLAAFAGGAVPVADWYCKNISKEKLNAWKIIRALSLGGLTGSIIGAAYADIGVAFLAGCTGEILVRNGVNIMLRFLRK